LEGTTDAAARAEDHFRQAVDWARRQRALSWELRAATSLAKMWHKKGRSNEARELLSAVSCNSKIARISDMPSDGPTGSGPVQGRKVSSSVSLNHDSAKSSV